MDTVDSDSDDDGDVMPLMCMSSKSSDALVCWECDKLCKDRKALAVHLGKRHEITLAESAVTAADRPVCEHTIQSKRTGRRANVTLSESRLEDFRLRVIDMASYQDLQQEFGLSRDAVYRLKRDNGLVRPPDLPTLQQLQEFFRDPELRIFDRKEKIKVPDAVKLACLHFNVSRKGLRKHFKEVGFDPEHIWPVAEVSTMLEEVRKRPWFNSTGDAQTYHGHTYAHMPMQRCMHSYDLHAHMQVSSIRWRPSKLNSSASPAKVL
jgi:hypothetical protein